MRSVETEVPVALRYARMAASSLIEARPKGRFGLAVKPAIVPFLGSVLRDMGST